MEVHHLKTSYSYVATPEVPLLSYTIQNTPPYVLILTKTVYTHLIGKDAFSHSIEKSTCMYFEIFSGRYGFHEDVLYFCY